MLDRMSGKIVGVFAFHFMFGQIVAVIVIGVTAYGNVVSFVVNLVLVGGVIASGVFLMLITVISYFCAITQHQILTFFYMVILFLIFLFQFSMACFCLAVNAVDSQRSYLAQKAWNAADLKSQLAVQTKYDCCGFVDPLNDVHPTCEKLSCCEMKSSDPACGNPFVPVLGNTTHTICSPCIVQMKNNIRDTFSSTGGVVLFFSLTEIVGMMLAVRCRHQKDSLGNPNTSVNFLSSEAHDISYH